MVHDRRAQLVLSHLRRLGIILEVDAPLERGERVAAVWQAIEELPADLKIALLLRDVVGLSSTEIAEALEITLSTLKWRIFKAREGVVLALRAEEAPETLDGPGRNRSCDLGLIAAGGFSLPEPERSALAPTRAAEPQTGRPPRRRRRLA